MQISESVLDAFLCRVEEGYKLHNNPYHNSTHASDVLQTVHVLIIRTKLSVSNHGADWLPSSGTPSFPTSAALCTLLSASVFLQEWLTKLEVLAMLFAAAIHDLEHTGTTNAFHVQS